jgi:tetratricopeptide (TPR) repeat protein
MKNDNNEIDYEISSTKQKNPLLHPDALHSTFWLGLITGLAVIIGYSLNLCGFGFKMLFIFILLGLASFISGFFLGNLFGIPKRIDEKDSEYHISNNLTDISDWLTKIIIGLGLVEIKAIPSVLYSLGAFVQKETNGEGSIKVFSICCTIYFSIFGLYFGYNYMRLFLSGKYKGADEGLNPVQKKLYETAEKLETLNKDPENIDNNTKKHVEEYNQLLKESKTENDYTFDDWYYKGVNAYQNKLFNEAIVFCEKALIKDNKAVNVPSAYLYIGASYLALGNNNQALDIYSKFLNDFPTFADICVVYNNIGVALYGLKYTQKAIENYEKSIELRPNYALPWYNKAIAYASLKQKDSMIVSLRKAIEIDNNCKSMALRDLDFNDYLEDDDFKKLMM